MDINDAYSKKMLDLELIKDQTKINGRINIIEPDNPNARMQMMERVMVKNKSAAYCDSIQGRWEDNIFSQVFFSKENIQIVQNAIRAGVYEMSQTKFIIPPPNLNNLIIIMRSYFLGYIQFENNHVTEEIEKINKMVTEYCVKELYSASTAYIQYAQDQSTMYLPFKLPQQNDRNYKQLELKNWV
jgi:hypothetical protein